MKTNNLKTISLEHLTYIKQVIIKEKEDLELVLNEYLASNIETSDKKHNMLVHELELTILDKAKLIHSLELSRLILSKEDQQSILTSLLKLDDELFMANIGGNLKSNDYYVKLREVIDYYYKIIK